jgi:Amt family ammonium transporter
MRLFTGTAATIVSGAVMGIPVSPEEELEGLDVGEHGIGAYPDFPTVAPHARLGAVPGAVAAAGGVPAAVTRPATGH